MKRTIASLLLAVALAVGVVSLGVANSSLIGTPGNAGRPTQDTVSNFRYEGRLERGIADCSNTTIIPTATSATSAPFNVTSVAGLDATKYPGHFVLYVYNQGTMDAIVFVNTTATAISGTQTAGIVVAAGSSINPPLHIACRNGVTVHFVGRTSTASNVLFSVCNE